MTSQRPTDSGGNLDRNHESSHQLLQTIAENEVTCFETHEDEQDRYPKITNKILCVDESFLYSSQVSLSDIEVAGGRKRAPTMHNIHERASFLNLTSEHHFGKMLQKALFYLREDVTFGSTSGLNTAVVDKLDHASEPLKEDSGVDTLLSLRYGKNLFVVSLTVTLMFIALGSVRNLQSSMNHEAGVGIISMAVSFTGYMVGSVFSASLVQIFHPKCCLVAGLVPQFTYIAANMYPAMWLMVPASVAQGFALAILWNAMSTYVILLARGKARMEEERFPVVSSRYFGFFGLFFQSYFIIGNLISSLVLSGGGPPPMETNTSSPLPSRVSPDNNYTLTSGLSVRTTEPFYGSSHAGHLHLCGSNFWQHYDLGADAYYVEEKTKFLLLAIYLGFVMTSIVLALCFLEKLNPRLFASTKTARDKIKHQLLSLKKFCADRHFLLLFPLLMYSFMEVGFITAEVTKAYVTCALGIHMVGYAMICFGVCGCLSSYTSGFLNKFTSYRPMLITASILNIAVLIHMVVWRPSPDDIIPFFIDFGLWGISDGIYVSQVNSLLSVIFPNNYEEAFAGLRIAQGFGVALVFACSGLLGMLSKIYITGAFCLVSVAAYLLMDVLREREMKKTVALLKETAI